MESRRNLLLHKSNKLWVYSCDKPENHGIGMTDWSQEMIAQVAQTKGLVTSISRAQVGRILKKTHVTTAKE